MQSSGGKMIKSDLEIAVEKFNSDIVVLQQQIDFYEKCVNELNAIIYKTEILNDKN
jgi:hypothetical protein